MSLKVTTRNLDKNGFTTVYIQYAYAERSKRFPTGVKVLPAGFEDGELVKCAGAAWKEHNSGLNDANDKIAEVKSALAKLIRRYTEDNHVAPTPEILEELYRAPQKALGVEKQTFWQLFDAYQAELEAKAERGNARVNTVRGLKPLRTLLKEFESARGIRLSFQVFNYSMLNSFNEFLQGEGYRNGTIRTRIAKLKAVLNHFVKVGLCKNTEWRNFTFDRKNQKDAPAGQRIFALSESEFTEWLQLDLSHDARLEYARDLFVLSATTGLRYSDAVRVGPQHVSNGAISITTQKTRETLTIPLNKFSRGVLEKYPQGMKHVDLANYNERLRLVAERCPSLDKPFQMLAYNGGKEIQHERGGQVKTRRRDFVSSHTGRKTFVCLCLMKGIPEFKVRAYTGHKDLTSFARYVDNEIGGHEFMNKFDF